MSARADEKTAAASDNLAVVLKFDDKIKTVQYLDGVSDVPFAVKHIVALHNSFSEALIALGITPVGAVERPQGAAEQLKKALADTFSVGDQSSPDYEKILSLQPDLILSVGDVHSQNNDLLQAIAPVISLREPDQDWRPWLLGLGAVLERQELAQDSDIILLDEPTTFLDMAHQLEVMQLLEKLNQQQRKTIVMVLHDLNQAARFAHHIIAIKQGEIVSQGSAHDIMCADVLRDVFGVEADFFEDPRTGKPVCISFGTCLK